MERDNHHKSKTANPPVWEEWGMFHEAKGCPDEELELCVTYEYWRERVLESAPRGSVAQWRQKFDEGYRRWLDEFKAFGAVEPPSEREGREYRFTMLDKAGAPSGFPFEIFSDFPEFPEKSWLKIPPQTRKERLKRIRGN